MTDHLTDTNVGNVEYIRRQDMVEECGEWYVEEGTEEGFIGTVSQMLDMFSPADVAPVVHSRWKYKCGEIQCPECGNRIHRIDLSGYLNFCPNCGAKMDGEE